MSQTTAGSVVRKAYGIDPAAVMITENARGIILFLNLFISLTNCEREAIGIERICQYLDNPIEKIDAPHKEQIDINKSLTKSDLPAISFENVFFRYSSDISNKISSTVRYALNDVTLNIKQGEKVAFCGR